MFCMCCETERKAGMIQVDSVATGEGTSSQIHSEPLDEPLQLSANVPPPPAEGPTKPAEVTDVGVKQEPMVEPDGKVEQAEEYQIELDRTNKKLGALVYNNTGEDFIRVRMVKEGGLIDEWNRANPTLPLKEGSVIAEVNGQRKPEEMRAVIANPQVTKLTVLVRVA
mmetsp:Transcript_30957/g.70866  ORF Transcript_30957/g.70866 Transcript_30957/m.70866 type:complete len:167 (-) Transcript_30957:101-601(-)